MAEQSTRHIKLNVARNVRHLDACKVGQTTWWCTHRNARPGDIMVIYKILHGIRWVLEVLENSTPEGEWCSTFGMERARVKVLRASKDPITARNIKENEILYRMSAVRRNFQGKLFNLSSKELQEINRLLK